MIRFAPATTSDLQRRAYGHVPFIGGRSGDAQTGLRKRRADLSSDTSSTPPSVGAEGSSKVDL